MKTKVKEQERAVKLRLEGNSILSIAKTLRVSKGSVHLWTKSLPIPEKFTKLYRDNIRVENNKVKEKIKEKRKQEIQSKKNYIREHVGEHVENVSKFGEPLFEDIRRLSGDGRWMIPPPVGYLGKKYIKDLYVYEHRLVMEWNLKRLLETNETVQHINGNKLDNKFSNLKLIIQAPVCKFVIHSRGDYKNIIDPTHPYADKKGRVLLHRYLVEQKIGRYLLPEEIIHHIDGNRDNNNIDNLEITTNSLHSKKHRTTGRAYVHLKCEKCGKYFFREKRKTNDGMHFCSSICRNLYFSVNMPKIEIIKKELVHGISGYKRGCKCTICKDAQNTRVRERRNKKYGVSHNLAVH